MAGTPHGLVDMKVILPATASHAWQEVYVGVTRFLTSSQAALCGISRIAFSTGSSVGADVNAQGSANDYWDTPNGIGNNAWGVYKWVSSSIVFYMLCQWAGNPGFGNAVPGSPGVLNAAGSQAGVGFQFAFNADGSSPWNGTTRNDGTDTKGSPVWTAGTSSLVVFPRANSGAGTFGSLKQQTYGAAATAIGGGPPSGTFYHVVADNDNFFFAYDSNGQTAYHIMHFGKFTPRSGTNHPNPYVMIGNDQNTYDPIIQFAQYGTNVAKDGGIAAVVPASGTRRLLVSGLNEFFVSGFQPNLILSPSTFDEFPIYIAMDEYPNSGYIGTLDYNFIRYIWGCASNDTNSTFTRAVFGNAVTGSAKVSVPWSGLNVPATGSNRSGSYF